MGLIVVAGAVTGAGRRRSSRGLDGGYFRGRALRRGGKGPRAVLCFAGHPRRFAPFGADSRRDGRRQCTAFRFGGHLRFFNAVANHNRSAGRWRVQWLRAGYVWRRTVFWLKRGLRFFTALARDYRGLRPQRRGCGVKRRRQVLARHRGVLKSLRGVERRRLTLGVSVLARRRFRRMH